MYEDLPHGAYGLRMTSFLDKTCIKDEKLTQRQDPVIDFTVPKTEEEAQNELQKAIRLHFERKPLIVFAEKPKIFATVKKLCDELKLPCEFIKTDEDLRRVSVHMMDWERGVVVVRREYGRGADLRFSKESHVIVPMQLVSLTELHQLVGRNYRTAG